MLCLKGDNHCVFSSGDDFVPPSKYYPMFQEIKKIINDFLYKIQTMKTIIVLPRHIRTISDFYIRKNIWSLFRN
jgi:hypothetical protein